MADWLRANCPNIEALIEELDQNEKETLPLGPYREQARDLHKDAFTRFAAKIAATETEVPSLSEILSQLDQQETAIVPLGDATKQLQEQVLEASIVRQEFLALGVSQSEQLDENVSRESRLASVAVGETTLAKTSSSYEQERKKALSELPLAKDLQARGIELHEALNQNQAEESERIGFRDYRMKDHITHVERRMQEILGNKMAWKAIKDKEVELQMQGAPKIRARQLGRGGMLGTRLPKNSFPVESKLGQVRAQSIESKAAKSMKEQKHNRTQKLRLGSGDENDEDCEEDEVEDKQCTECGIFGIMIRCRRCSAFLCSTTCREEHEESTCGGIFGGSSESTSDCAETEEVVAETQSGSSSMGVSTKTEASRTECFSVTSTSSRSAAHNHSITVSPAIAVCSEKVVSGSCSNDVEFVVPSAEELLAQLDAEEDVAVDDSPVQEADIQNKVIDQDFMSVFNDSTDVILPSLEQIIAQLDAETLADQAAPCDTGVQRWTVDVD